MRLSVNSFWCKCLRSQQLSAMRQAAASKTSSSAPLSTSSHSATGAGRHLTGACPKPHILNPFHKTQLVLHCCHEYIPCLDMHLPLRKRVRYVLHMDQEAIIAVLTINLDPASVHRPRAQHCSIPVPLLCAVRSYWGAFDHSLCVGCSTRQRNVTHQSWKICSQFISITV